MYIWWQIITKSCPSLHVFLQALQGTSKNVRVHLSKHHSKTESWDGNAISGQRAARRGAWMFLSAASEWPGYVWHQLLPARTFPLLHLVDFSLEKISTELLISSIGIYDKLLSLFTAGCEVEWETQLLTDGEEKRMLKYFSQGYLQAFILTLTASLTAARPNRSILSVSKSAIVHACFSLWHWCYRFDHYSVFLMNLLQQLSFCLLFSEHLFKTPFHLKTPVELLTLLCI